MTYLFILTLGACALFAGGWWVKRLVQSSTRAGWPLGTRRVAVALARKPATLPEVEVELRGPPPRKATPYFSNSSGGNPHLPLIERLQQTGVATTAWVIDTFSDQPELDQEGRPLGAVTRLACRYAFLDGQGRVQLGYADASAILEDDQRAHSMHYSGDARYHWVLRHFQRSRTFTVIYPSGAPRQSEVYGLLNPYLQRGLRELLSPDAPSASRESDINGVLEETLSSFRSLAHRVSVVSHVPSDEESAAMDFLEALGTHFGTRWRFFHVVLDRDDFAQALQRLAVDLQAGRVPPDLEKRFGAALARFPIGLSWAPRWDRSAGG